jgi:trans-aconitate methyltransferase
MVETSIFMYSWDPELYSSSSSAQKNWGLELLGKLCLKGDERILDVGCGDGKLSSEIARSLSEGSVLGIDLSEEMIAFAKEHYPLERFPNLTFMQMDATELRFDSEFDIIFSNAALHWIKNQKPLLKGFWKSLKPGGKLLVQMGGKGNAADVFKIIDSMLEEEKWGSYFRNFVFPYGFYEPEEYEKWLKDAGFSVKSLELISKVMILEGERGLFNWFSSTWHPYIQQIPEESRDVFIAELVTRFVNKYPPDSKGCIHVKMMRLEVEASAEKANLDKDDI